MNLRNKKWARALAIALAALLMAMALPAGALAEAVSARVSVDSMPVYVKYKGKVKKASLPKDTVVSVSKVSDGLALFRFNGYSCVAQVKNLEAMTEDAPETAPATGGERAVVRVATRAYAKPTTKSKYVKVAAGTELYVLATKGNIAQVRSGSKVAYMYLPHLALDGDAGAAEESTPQGSKVPSLKEAFLSGKYSNEQLIFLFLTQEMGYNTAAAAGVLANINYESGFRTTINGDGGTSYGICQWHASRKTRLINYCSEHGLSADSLVGQLAYLKYELENYYPKVHRYLKSVSNTDVGAYEAGYYFCYNFEGPAAKESQSTKRAQSAKNTYYGRYASI